MKDRTLELLAPALDVEGAVVIDATLGMGGHSEAILELFPTVRLIGLDRDTAALAIARERLERFASRIHLVHCVYDEIALAWKATGLPAPRGILFDLGVSSLHLDDKERGFAEIKKICERKKHRVIEYGFKACDLRLQKIEPVENGQKVFFEFEKKNYQFELSVSGEFQAFNALCALGNVLTKNNLDQIPLEKFNILQPAPGRMQRAGTLPNKAQVYIDFAHTPDALENVLKLAREITKKRVVVLFGCGGDRDAKKRPIMGKLACELADLVIVSDDNPRTEKAETIRDEILAECDMAKTVELNDRKHAIEKAVQMLEAGDILILAGKGHEKYQIIGATKFEFDEEKIVKNAIAKLT
jgi:UDP-N-acetylmuramoyl-L-alanyl-D-glutamate--2,6-diaminopimelate ligase